MPRPDARRLHAALLDLGKRALDDHRLLAECQRARREFFGEGDGAVTAVQEQRFFEWFLLERESLALAAVPVEILALDGDQEDLLESTVGVFRIESLHDHGVEVRDLQDDEAMQLLAPAGALQVGDMIVGRLYLGGRDGWQPSASIAVYRPGEAIAAAFQRDLARLELDRRLSQIELEHLLLRQQASTAMVQTAVAPAPTAVAVPQEPRRPIEHIEAELETLLVAGGTPGLATEISEALAQAERPGPVVGPVLDQLAFDTKVDLERARRTLIELWSAHHVDEDVEAPAEALPTKALPPILGGDQGPPGESLGEKLVRTLDAGLGKKQDLEELFRQLEAMAGIEPDDDDDDDDALLATERAIERRTVVDDGGEDDDYDGDFAPLVAEFVWETQCSGSETEALLQLWVELQRNAALPHTDFDAITGQDLMRLLLHVYLRAEPVRRAAAVRAAFGSVQQFSAWAEETQEMTLQTAMTACQGSFLDAVDRLETASLRLSRPAVSGGSAPMVLQVEQVDKDGYGVRGDEGDYWVPADAATTALLRPGDLLLAAVDLSGDDDRLAGPVVALPGDAAALIG